VWVLAGCLRIAIALDRAKDQSVTGLSCQLSDQALTISAAGKGDLAIELWAARRDRQVLEKALQREVSITVVS